MKHWLLGVLLLCAGPAWSRWFTAKDIPLLIKNYERKTTVAADGTAVDRWMLHLRVQRQEAREDVGFRSIRFHRNVEEVKVLTAQTITDGKVKKVSPSDMVERAVTDESPGFSSLHELVISFPDVQVGSEILLTYEIRTTQALEVGFWGQTQPIDPGVYEKFRWIIESEKPLYEAHQDPFDWIAVKTSKRAGRTVVDFQSRKPFSLALADELTPYLGESKKILLLASFLKDWKEYGVASAKAFEDRLKDSFREDDEKFARGLAKVSSPTERMEKILRRLHSRLRYFGDWRASEHMYVPRALSEINRTLSGDCKDFALVAVKLMRLAGLDAVPVWLLNEDIAPSSAVYALPTDSAFNHVIVRVTAGSESWWVDPTNTSARVDFLPDEIAGRPGLILRSTGSELIPIRAVTSQDYRSRIEAEVLGSQNGLTRVRLHLIYEGYSPVAAGEQHRQIGTAVYVEEHVRRLMPMAPLRGLDVEKIEEDPTTGDLRQIVAVAVFENFLVWTGQGSGFIPTREETVDTVRGVRLPGRVGDVYLGKVYSYQERIHLKGLSLQGKGLPRCQVESPWLRFSQNIIDDPSGPVFESRFELLKSELSIDDQTRGPLIKLREDLRECAGRQVLLLKSPIAQAASK